MLDSLVSRRTFLSALGGAVAVTALPALSRFGQAAAESYAFVATDAGIHTMEPVGSEWRSRSFIPADAPRAMVRSSNGKTLFVANATGSYRSLPTGSVTAYQVAADGTLQRLGSTALALSAVRPYALALSPNDCLLAVLSEGGVLSLIAPQADGQLGQVVAVHKTLTTKQLSVRFQTDSLLHLEDGDSRRTFRASAHHGFALVSSKRSRTARRVRFDDLGIADAKATLCVSA